MLTTNNQQLKTVVCLLLISLLALGWTEPQGKAKKPPQIKVGAILSLTGSGAELGNDTRDGIVLALKHLQSKTDSPNIRILFEDSESEPIGGVNAFEKLSIYEVQIILTGLSGVSMALVPLTEEKKTVVLTIAADPDITKEKRYVIRMFPTSYAIAEKIAELLSQNKVHNVGVLYSNDAFGWSVMESLQKKYSTKGGNIVSSQSFEPQGIDYRSEITKVLGKNPEAIFVVGYDGELGLVIKQTRELGFKGTLYSVPEVAYPDVQKIAGNALEGCIFVSVQINSEDPEVKAFIEQYKASTGSDPCLDSFLGYDEIMLINEALHIAKNTGKSLRDAFFSISNLQCLTGNLTVKENGDVEFPLVFKTFLDGDIVDFTESHKK